MLLHTHGGVCKPLVIVIANKRRACAIATLLMFAMQDFGGEAAYAPFHESTFQQHLARSSHNELSLMQQMLDWREHEIQHEISLLDAADDRSQGMLQMVPLQLWWSLNVQLTGLHTGCYAVVSTHCTPSLLYSALQPQPSI